MNQDPYRWEFVCAVYEGGRHWFWRRRLDGQIADRSTQVFATFDECRQDAVHCGFEGPFEFGDSTCDDVRFVAASLRGGSTT